MSVPNHLSEEVDFLSFEVIVEQSVWFFHQSVDASNCEYERILFVISQ